jgi:glutathione S-transferase
MRVSVGMRLYDYPASANCLKVRLLLAQLGLPYERVPVDIFAGETLTNRFAAINPARTTPVLEPSPGRYLPESAAILFHLAEGTPFLPDEPFERAQVVRWLAYEQTEVVPATGGLRFRLVTGRLAPDDEEAVRRRRAGEDVLRLLHAHLAEREFFVDGSYTIADIALYGYVHVAGEAGFELERHPAVAGWLQRVAGQPGHVNDLEPYPANARAGSSRSIYD